MHPTSVLQYPSCMRDTCPGQRKRTHETGQTYLGEAPTLMDEHRAPQRASARPNPGARRGDRISGPSRGRFRSERLMRPPATRARISAMTWLAISATANSTSASPSGNSDRTRPVSTDAGLQRRAIGNSTATVFCRAARSAAVADSLALLRLSTAASRSQWLARPPRGSPRRIGGDDIVSPIGVKRVNGAIGADRRLS